MGEKDEDELLLPTTLFDMLITPNLRNYIQNEGKGETRPTDLAEPLGAQRVQLQKQSDPVSMHA